MPEDSDVIEIPLTIRTQDLQAIRQIEQEIDESESKLRSIKTSRNKIITGGQAPIQTPTIDDSSRTGIFKPQTAEEVLPSAFRDKTTRQPFRRENEFLKLRDQVNQMKEENKVTNNLLNSLFGISFFTQGPNAGKVNPSASAGGVLGKASSFLSGGGIAGLATRLAPFLAGALIAIGFADDLMKYLLRDGGEFDRRYRRKIEKEVNQTLDRTEKQALRQGIEDVRVTSSSKLRIGARQVRTTKEFYIAGAPLYDLEYEAFAKGVK